MQIKIKIEIEKDIKKILNILRKKSEEAYIVGGYIRDKLLGLEAKDCDFCSILSLEELVPLFSEEDKEKDRGKNKEKEFKLEIISEKLNIVKIKFNNKKFEIARLRKDIKYYNNRKNFDFIFINNIEEDLLRRDFTINAFAYNEENLFFINEEQFSDIQQRRLKFIGNPELRIKEDPFRILRAFRFFSEKNLLVFDERTILEIEKNKDLIWTLPKEMIQSEFIKIIKGDNYLETFRYINQVNLFNEKFYVGAYRAKYEDRIKELFKESSDFSLLKNLNFSNKFLKKF